MGASNAVRSATFASIMSFEVLPIGFPLLSLLVKGSTLLELNSLVVVIYIQIFSTVLYENPKLSELVSIGVAKLPERQEPKLSTDKASGHGPCEWC